MDTNFDFNKTGKFDFGKVGKRMPYSTPEGFFKEMEANILAQVNNGIQEVDKAFAQLSSADQAYLLSVYQEDVFLNN